MNLGYTRPSGDEVWTHASCWKVDRDLAEDYNTRLAELFGGEVRTGQTRGDGAADRWVTRSDGSPFRIEDILDHLPDWLTAIEHFQDDFRKRAQDAER